MRSGSCDRWGQRGRSFKDKRGKPHRVKTLEIFKVKPFGNGVLFAPGGDKERVVGHKTWRWSVHGSDCLQDPKCLSLGRESPWSFNNEVERRD